MSCLLMYNVEKKVLEKLGLKKEKRETQGGEKKKKKQIITNYSLTAMPLSPPGATSECPFGRRREATYKRRDMIVDMAKLADKSSIK